MSPRLLSDLSPRVVIHKCSQFSAQASSKVIHKVLEAHCPFPLPSSHLTCSTVDVEMMNGVIDRYVGEEDMEFFKERLGKPAGCGDWEHMMSKDFGTFTYEAWRRSTAVHSCTYSSVIPSLSPSISWPPLNVGCN